MVRNSIIASLPRASFNGLTWAMRVSKLPSELPGGGEALCNAWQEGSLCRKLYASALSKVKKHAALVTGA